MSASVVGLLIGIVVAIADFVLLTFLGRSAGLSASAGVLRFTAIVQLILFPVIGWFVGPYIFGDA